MHSTTRWTEGLPLAVSVDNRNRGLRGCVNVVRGAHLTIKALMSLAIEDARLWRHEELKAERLRLSYSQGGR